MLLFSDNPVTHCSGSCVRLMNSDFLWSAHHLDVADCDHATRVPVVLGKADNRNLGGVGCYRIPCHGYWLPSCVRSSTLGAATIAVYHNLKCWLHRRGSLQICVIKRQSIRSICFARHGGGPYQSLLYAVAVGVEDLFIASLLFSG